MRIFAKAAKEAGITTNGTTQELFKQMELGKVMAKDILPHVAKGFRDFAKQGDALNKSVSRFSVLMGRAQFDLQVFQKTLFDEGVEDGLKFLLSGFNDLMKSSTFLTKSLGGAFKGAVVGLTAPFRLLYAVIYDVTKLLGMDAQDTMGDWVKGISTAIGAVLGLVASLWALKKAWGMLKGIKGLVNIGGGKAVKSGSSSGSGGKGIAGLLGVQKVFVVNMGAGGMGLPDTPSKAKKASKMGKLGGLLGLTAVAEVTGTSALLATATAGTTATIAGLALPLTAFGAALYTAIELLPDSTKYDQAKPPTAYRSSMAYGGQGNSNAYGAQPPQKIEVVVSAKEDWVDAKINDSQNWMGDGIYN